MPSLLERLIQSQAGMFGPPEPVLPTIPDFSAQPPAPAAPPVAAVPQQMRGPGSFGGPFGRLFAGGDDPRLGQAQNDAIRKQALIDAGLGLLAGSSSPIGKPSLMQALGNAAMFANQGAEARRGQALAQESAMQNAALRASVFRGLDLGDPEDRVTAVSRLLSAGFEDAAKIVNDMPEAATGGKFTIVKDANGSPWAMMQEGRGELLNLDGSRMQSPIPPEKIAGRNIQRVTVDRGGRPMIEAWDMDAVEHVGTIGKAPPNTLTLDQAPTPSQVKARMQANNLRNEFNVIAENLDAVPGLFDPRAWLPNALRDEDRRQFDAAISTFNSLVGRALSGVAIRPDEREQVRGQLEIMPADKNQPEVIADKLRRLQDWIAFVDAGAGGVEELPPVVEIAGVGGGNFFRRPR